MSLVSDEGGDDGDGGPSARVPAIDFESGRLPRPALILETNWATLLVGKF